MRWHVPDGAEKGPEQRKNGMHEPKITSGTKFIVRLFWILDVSLLDLLLSERGPFRVFVSSVIALLRYVLYREIHP